MTSAKLLTSLKTTMIVAFLAILPAFVIAPHASAETNLLGNLQNTQDQTSLKNTDLPSFIGSIINIVLSFLGVIFLVLTIYAGFLWMTAGGKPEQTETARKMLINATIGLVLILAAFAISNFVLTSLQGTLL
ncbi:hypothetical protein COY25_01825 [Candidatus Uhrbacteria bacterium CG_4_10_14_0_2_um_filter_41_7]|uniref:Uncharacterized protein n=1 Tax=Candidatus Uhrbacteria bacterium CG_4_9_14_3_um_filter_41_35 TaxID=1975034 RepID=A0A2M7XEB1_9BACT|nr:MAG: hypothetical protein COY25_01825 [Candidatus Uhrbacteria bacterium CG_4_10_14_0_2_um_filter_41_7]PJA46231.1 MAG: hypothetical protein CO173_03360 [Candidatus Uhrbacteria bacterium CG_4_9_14_3_um_filter_41_35]